MLQQVKLENRINTTPQKLLLQFFYVSTMIANVTFVNTLLDEADGQNLVLKYPVMFGVL